MAKYENLILVSERKLPVRMPPLPADEWDDEVYRALDGLVPKERHNPAAAGNLVSTLVRHPKLAKAYLQYSFYLLYASTLPDRVRELAILRVAHRTGSEYEWLQHVKLGRRIGLSDDEIDGVTRGEAADEFERGLLTAADELLDKYTLSDGTWTLLSERLDEQQLMDLVFMIGSYAALGMAFNTFGLELDDDIKDITIRTRKEG